VMASQSPRNTSPVRITSSSPSRSPSNVSSISPQSIATPLRNISPQKKSEEAENVSNLIDFREEVEISPTFPDRQDSIVTSHCSYGERLCRAVLEGYFRKPFPPIRPKWLYNPETNRNLELDCYNEELRIALEYNGIQHYNWPNFTGQTQEQFIQQVRRDTFKKSVCDELGILLIVVPYTISESDLSSYIISKLPSQNGRISDTRS